MPIPSIPDVRPARTSRVTSADAAAVQVVAQNPSRAGLTIHNAGSQTEYLGTDNTVTTSTGFPLASGESFSDALSSSAWWAVRAAGTADLRVLEVLAKST